jgi:FkbM family methyltransferase
VEFRPTQNTLAQEFHDYVKVKVRARVYEGEIGVGVLTPEGNEYQQEIQLAAKDDMDLIEICLRPGLAPGALIVRNTSARGGSTIDFNIVGCELCAGEVSTINEDNEIEVDPAIFTSFKSWSGLVPCGYFTDWTGILTRADVWAFNEEYLATFNKDRHENPSVPLNGEHVLDWAPLAMAVKDSHITFRMAALGAGWGRWLAAGAALAAQIGHDYRLLGVEAEPQHFQWMLRHFRENDIPEERYIALNAAAAGKPGDCCFLVGNSQGWYGQSISAEGNEIPNGAELRRTNGVTLDELLNRLSPLDYLHMDIQGAELDVLSYQPDRLDREVNLVNIGTHSAGIEAGLRKLFNRLGWECLYDIELGSKRSVRIGDSAVHEVEFGDGVQVWQNPRLKEDTTTGAAKS